MMEVNRVVINGREKTWRQIYTILAVCLNTITTGQMVAWTSPSIPILRQQGVSMSAASYLTIIPSATMIFVSPLVGKLIDVAGRRPALLGVSLTYVLSWTLLGVASLTPPTSAIPPLGVYYAARVLNGIGDSCCFSTVPCYVAEIATPSVRGAWGNCVSLSVFFGQFLMNLLGACLSISHAACLSLALPAAFLLNFAFLRESPYYLLTKGRVEDARLSLQWLRDTPEVEAELSQLQSDVERQLSETGRFVDLLRIPSNRKACLVGVLLRASQQFSGISAFIVYAQTIFIESGSDLSPSISAIVFTSILFMCTVCSSFVLDRLGRRKAMLISCTGACAVLSVQTAFFYVQDETNVVLEGFQLFPLVSMIVFVPVYSLGLGLVPTLMLGELFSSSVKSKAFVVMNVFFGLSTAASAKIFAVCLDVAGMYAAFLFFAICSVGAILISCFVVPETKGKTLEEIQQSFKQ